MSNKTTVIYHSADFDGQFCHQIARKFLGSENVDYIGWDFGDKALEIPGEGQIIIMDLPVDRVFGLTANSAGIELGGGNYLDTSRFIWIDHHASSIAPHPADIPGYRIDGVSACRLAWQWFAKGHPHIGWEFGADLPTKEEFVERTVTEPLAVRLAGEYDIWDKRDERAEVFQFGLRSFELTPEHWSQLLRSPDDGFGKALVVALLHNGALLQRYQQQNDAGVMKARSFVVEFEGLKFLALNTARCNSLTFAAKDVPETGHAALMGFFFNGTIWKFSLYGARHNPGLDLSAIAKKYGGGGHKQACGFEAGFWSVSFDEGSLKIADLSKAKKV